jgi:hypothetical protein
VAHYEDTLTLRDARQRYFGDNGFGDGGYEERWVKLKAGPVPIYLPNTAARVRAVKLHDLHHALTGYDTTWTGEGEIAAWEIASGCADHYAAWVLNLQAMAIGLAIAPRALFRAFVRGRRSANLYRTTMSDELLSETVGSARQRLHVDGADHPATPADRAAFATWSVAAATTLSASVLAFYLPLIAFVAWLF